MKCWTNGQHTTKGFLCVLCDLFRFEVTDSEGGVTQIWVNFGGL